MYDNDEFKSPQPEEHIENKAEEKSNYFDYTNIAPAQTAEQSEEHKKGKAARKHREKKGTFTFRKALACAGLGLCFGVFSGLGFYGIKVGSEKLTGTENTGSDAVISQVAPTISTNEAVGVTRITYVEDQISDMVENVMPAMVSIVNNYTTNSMNFWGQTVSVPGAASGSGIIVGKTDKELLIVSNNHVVEGTTGLEVTFIDESKATASIKGLDADMDLAVIAVKLSELSNDTLSKIAVASLGDSNSLKLGEPVVAIGNALGYGQSVTNGIISALNREVETEDGEKNTFIQTNAAINPGNSGGALLNINGEVIGINSNKIGGSTVEGMGYAIPISAASPIISDLMNRQTRDKVDEDEIGYMGITMQDVTSETTQMYNIPKGIFVYNVEEGSPAEQAGIKKGDIIVKFDGQRISTSSDLKSALEYFRAGDTATITVQRTSNGEYQPVDLNITLGKRPQGNR